MTVTVKARSEKIGDSAFGEKSYTYLVDGLNVNQPTNHPVTVPLRAFQERRERELVPPCASCITDGCLMHVPIEEYAVGSNAAHRYRPMNRHDPETCSGDHCFTVSSCTCGECDCCLEALKIVLEECLVAQQPDQAHKLSKEKKQRYVAIGVLQHHEWDDDTKDLKEKRAPADSMKPFSLTVEL